MATQDHRDEKNERDRDREYTGTSNQTGDLDRVTNMDTSLDSGLDNPEETAGQNAASRHNRLGQADKSAGEVESGPESRRGNRGSNTADE